MKICVISQSLYTLGGIQRVLATLFNKMVEMKNLEITVMMPHLADEKNIFGLSDDIKIINTINYENNDIMSLFYRMLRKINQKSLIFEKIKAFWLLKRFVLLPGLEQKYMRELSKDYDVVIGVGCWYSILLAYLSPQITAKTVGWMHSTYESYFYNNGVLSAGFSEAFKETANQLDEILVLTESDKRVFDSKLGVDTKVLYNPVADLFFEEHDKTYSKNTLLFVGRINMQHKGIDFLIPIMHKVLSVFPETELTIVGDGPDMSQLKELISSNNLTNHIHLVGQKTDVKSYYDKASLLLVPSRWEGFGVVLIESMACGTPVVAFENKGPNEIITNGIDGILIEKANTEKFADAIIKLLEDREKMSNMSHNAKKKAAKFSAEKAVETFMSYVSR